MATLAQLPDTSMLAELCHRFHARKLSLFGSAVRGELRRDSDVDLLVEFDSACPIGYFTLVEMSDALRPLFGGRPIDLVTDNALHPLIRKYVVREMRTLYEE